MEKVPYIGSQISLVSKSEIRYVGTLYNINIENSTVALHNVKVYGTEGRRKDGAQIPPSNEIFEYVIFSGSDIKDLDVWSPPAQSTNPALYDPAIISSSAMPVPVSKDTESNEQNHDDATADDADDADNDIVGAIKALTEDEEDIDQEESKNVAQGTNARIISDQRVVANDSRNGNEAVRSQRPRRTQDGRPNYQRGRGGQRGHEGYRRGRGSRRGRGGPIPGMGQHLLSRRSRGGRFENEDYDGEFDFDSMNDKFDKETEMEMAKLSVADPSSEAIENMDSSRPDNASGPGYSKSSFFDTISCDITDRQAGRNARMTNAEERELNTQTFGAVSLGSKYDHRQRFRGAPYRGRGGGRFRGRGRRGNGGRRRDNVVEVNGSSGRDRDVLTDN